MQNRYRRKANEAEKRIEKVLLKNAHYLNQWHLHSRAQSNGLLENASINCEEAWIESNSFGNESVTVCIADDGFNLKHSAFSENRIISPAFVSGKNILPSRTPNDMFIEEHGHGTELGCVVGAKLCEDKPVGICPACSILPVRWDYHNGRFCINEYSFLHILDYISDKCDIMLNSWSKQPIFGFSDSTLKVIESLGENGGRNGSGILFVWAAGNSNTPLNYDPKGAKKYLWKYFFPGKLESYARKITDMYYNNDLCNLKNVLTVGSVTSYSERSLQSCWGDGLSICAPSSNMKSTDDMEFKGLGITTCTYKVKQNTVKPGITNNFKGTSAAAAIVAGGAALIKSIDTAISANSVAEILCHTANRNLKLPTTSDTAPQDLFRLMYGAGRVDVHAAAKVALANTEHAIIQDT
jgi:subtilisin family serine protease